MKKIEKVAIANRGEVAARIIRACHELGIETALLHSEADSASLAYRLCNEPICIGPAQASESYLDIEANITGALACGADAIHPGFGFLSENASFAQACVDAGLVFIGPSPETISLLGDKIRAKELVEGVGVAAIPGYQGGKQEIEVLAKKAVEIGFPVVVKAAAGGGGRGMKVIQNTGELQSQIESAKRECLSAFGSEKVFLEKYLDCAKHIEVQVFGDATGKVHALLERECTIQRRHQKIIEEALSPSLTEPLREQICAAAIRVAEAAKYVGAGTVEFLLQDDAFYFLEMNTRLQVEHPVTEMVLGVDLVKAQILTAERKPLDWPETWRGRGHAIECRIYAEDPYNSGMPSTGLLGSCKWPEGPGRRFEVGFEKGDSITQFYDPMFAKVIVWDETRSRAIEKMLYVLSETVVFGVKTNIPFLKEILCHPDFVSGSMTTKFLETHFPEGLCEEPANSDIQSAVFKILAGTAGEGENDGQRTSQGLSHGANPWRHQWSHDRSRDGRLT